MYIIKQIKNNFINLVFLGFEKWGFANDNEEQVGPTIDSTKIWDKWPRVKNPDLMTESLGMSHSVKHSTKMLKELVKWQNEEKEKTKEKVKTLSNDVLKDINNHDFLKLSPEKRLIHITKNWIDSNEISSWKINTLEFTFTFDWKFNKELYLKTTAGQVLPQEVWVVKIWSETYSRAGLNWEFFTQWNKRLIIKEWTKIDIEKVRTSEEIKDIQIVDNENIYQFSKSPDYKPWFDDIISESVKRWIDPKFALLAFSEKVKDLSIMDLSRIVIIEEMFTEYDRKKGKISSVFKNKEEAIQISILKEFTNDWKENAKKYGIKEEVIKSTSNIVWSIDFKKISWWDLSKVDFRSLKNKYPREASIKNNNPAWLTWNNTFANTLRNNGINFYKWTSRPSREWWSYFWFENMEEWMNAYNLLWEIKLKKSWNKTFWDFAKKWAVDYSSYKRQFWNIWNQKLSSLSNENINIIKSKQMRIESPWMHKELSKLWVV